MKKGERIYILLMEKNLVMKMLPHVRSMMYYFDVNSGSEFQQIVCRTYVRGSLCVEMGFTWTFSRNQDAKVKLKSELIFIKSAPSLFKIIYSVSGYPKCPTSVLSSLWQRRPQQYPVTKPTTNAATAPALTVIIKVSRENSAWEASIT